ncbi:MAG: replication initiation protein [Arcicella sp.]|jgi:plasmid replication initiation protein|nr:replication initiation protein [Arcicella sp.]
MVEDKRRKALEIISKDPYRIVKGNPIINAKYEISAIQAKIFLHMISKIDITKPDFQEITIGVQEFAKFANIDSKDLYKIVRTESVKLMDKKIAYEDDKITLDSVLLASVVYNKKQGTYTFEFPKKLAPFLLQLKDNFTGYDLHNVLTLESAYSIRFFEFCKQYEKIGKFTFGVEELKEIFGITDKYKNYFDFKKKVVLQAQKELKEFCELYFSFREVKQGKKVVELVFTIHKNSTKFTRLNGQTQEQLPQEEAENPAVIEIYTLVQEYLSKDIVEKWFSQYSYEQIRAGVLYSIQENKAGRVKEMPKYLQTMVKTPSLLQEQQKHEQELLKKKQQKQKAESMKQVQGDLEREKKELQANFYQRFNDYIVSQIKENENLHTKLLEKLNAEYNRENRPFLTELAFDNYKPVEGTKPNSKEEFLGNYLKNGGAFNTFVFIAIQNDYPAMYELVRKPFDTRAKELNIKLD